MPFAHSFDDTPIYYNYTPGEKETIVFIHGRCLNHTTWSTIAQHMQTAGYGILCIDLRGH